MTFFNRRLYSFDLFRKDATPVKVYGETSLIFPLLVAETFARDHHNLKDWLFVLSLPQKRELQNPEQTTPPPWPGKIWRNLISANLKNAAAMCVYKFHVSVSHSLWFRSRLLIFWNPISEVRRCRSSSKPWRVRPSPSRSSPVTPSRMLRPRSR